MPKGENYKKIVEARKEKIYAFEIMGMPRKLMLEYAMQQWGIKSSSVDNYRREIAKQLSEDFQEHKQKALERSLALRRYMIFECLQENDIEQAFKILSDTDRMLGLYSPEKFMSINFNGNEIDWNKLNEDQIKELAEGADPSLVLSSVGDS